MAKEVAPVKATSGAGFAFEDMVAAHFAALMLSGISPLAPKQATIRRIDFQVRVDEWHLDDILLTMDTPSGVCRLAISVKSNAQFSSSAASKEFVEACWQHYLGREGSPFIRGQDLLGLITGPQPGTVFSDMQALLGKCRDQDANDLPRRLTTPGYASQAQISLFQSFACPPVLAQGDTDEPAVVDLLKHVWIDVFDYEQQPSHSAQRSQEICVSAVQSGSQSDASQLWERLLAVANRIRLAGGYLDLPKLLHEIQPAPRLLMHPDFRDAWRRLVAWGQSQMRAVPTLIGGQVSIDRSDAIELVKGALAEAPQVALLGSPGTGKSVVARQWAESLNGDTPVIWVPAAALTTGGLDGVRQRAGITEALERVLESVPENRAYVVLDGIDRVANAEAATAVTQLLRALGPLEPPTPWRVVLTCQIEHWDRILSLLASAGLHLPWREVQLAVPDDARLKVVWTGFPALQFLPLNRHLGDLLKTPKILDLLANGCARSSFADASRWVGESDLIEWYWNTQVSQGAASVGRRSFLMKLGQVQADAATGETPLLDLEASPALESLVSDQLCRVHEERLAFSHDLLGDWARQRAILSHRNNIAAYLGNRVELPYWHRAIRLFGLALLEGSDNADQWTKAKDELPAATDLFLDAAIFAADAGAILERLWPVLAAEKGLLLRRLLNRFHHVATLPHPALANAAAPDVAELLISLRANLRVPYSPYWLATIPFLVRHAADVIAIAKVEAARIVKTWLLYTPPNTILRKEAAELALALAHQHLAARESHAYGREEDAQLVFQAGLAAATDLPEPTAAFALMASGRVVPDGQKLIKRSFVPPGTMVRMGRPWAPRVRPKPEPWPGGPLYRIDEAFQAAALDHTSLVPLMRVRPEAAGQVILASLIEERREDQEDEDDPEYRMPDKNDGFSFHARLYPPLHNQGPFLPFLLIAPEAAISAILRLVDFATARWADGCRRHQAEPAKVVIALPAGDKAYIGSYQVFYWYCGSPFAADAVVSALMAIEQWLYTQIEAKQPVDKWCAHILEQSSSVANLGLLLEIGRREPVLFAGVLRPLLAVAELYAWEQRGQIEGAHGWKTMGAHLVGPWYAKAVNEWNSMPHRKHSISNFAQWLFLFDPDSKEFFVQARARWQAALQATLPDGDMYDHLQNLVAWFDPANWKQTTHDGRNAVMYEPPVHLLERQRKYEEESADDNLLLTLPLQCRMRIDKGQALAPEEIDKWWTMTRHVAEVYTRNDENRGAAALCGAIAVVFVLNREWLRQRPAEEEWAINEIAAIIEKPPQRGEFDVPNSAGDFHWDDFCAQVVPLLWSESPASERIRTMVARLAMGFHYNAVGRLCHGCFQVRDQLGDGSWQLWHFVTRWAALRDQIQDRRRRDNPVDVGAWCNIHATAFVNGSISPVLPRWADVLEGPVRLMHANNRHESDCLFRPLPIDRDLMMHAFGWLPNLDEAKNAQERSRWLGFWREVHGTMQELLRCFNKEGEEVEDDNDRGDPYPFDRWALQRLAILMPLLRDDEHPEDLWKPFFALGRMASGWIEELLFWWFARNLSTANEIQFVEQWQAMIAFATQCPTWAAREGVYWAETEDIWCHLFGFASHIRDCWEPEHAPLVARMRNSYAAWAVVGLKSADGAEQFAQWLARPAAQPLRLDALEWMDEVGLDLSGDRHCSARLRKSLASLLFVMWEQERASLRARARAWGAYCRLLQRLSDCQEPVAMELQQRITQD